MTPGEIWRRLRFLFRRDQFRRELEEEMQLHIAMKAQARLDRQEGFSAEEARRGAQREFGNALFLRERSRDLWGFRWLESLALDLRYGARMLWKNWKPASIAGVSLALAMALGIAGFSVFNGLFLRPIAAADPARLVSIYAGSPRLGFGTISYPDFEYFRERNHSFSGIAAFANFLYLGHVTRGDSDEAVTVEAASDNYFSVLGIEPLLGRLFAPGDDQTTAPVAVLTYARWKRWGADPRIIGQSLIVKGHVVTIVGVAPKSFTGVVFGVGADLILTLGSNAAVSNATGTLARRDHRGLFLIGRLKPRVAAPTAAAELRTLSAQLAAAFPRADKDRSAVIRPAVALAPGAFVDRSTAAWVSAVLIAIGLLVLLIACANVATLLLGLATGRKQEILIRASLGATRARLIRQLLSESAILCAAGGGAGFLLVSAVLARFSQVTEFIPILGPLHLTANLRANATVLALTLVLILLATLAAGLAPALYGSSPNVAGSLSGEAVIGGRRKALVRHALVAIQVAICTLVLVGAGLCVRSVQNLDNVPLGFSPENLAAVMIDLDSNHRSQAEGRILYHQLKEEAARLRGIQSASLGVEFPLIDDQWSADDVRIEDARGGPEHQAQIATNVVDGGYFSTLRIPLLAGRTFDSADTKDAPAVAVINHDMAVTYWPGANAVGRQMRIGKDNRMVTVVGVVADGKYGALDEPLYPVIYYPLSQNYVPGLLLMVRTRADPRLAIRPLSRLVRRHSLTLDTPPFTSSEVMSFALMIPRITLEVIGSLGLLALMLAILGLYGAIFYSVHERRKEIGIRVALGAQPSHLLNLFLRQTAIVAGLGVAAGLCLGVGATLIFRSQFFGIGPVEMYVLVPVALAMALISLAIAYAAARPWIRVNPSIALKYE